MSGQSNFRSMRPSIRLVPSDELRRILARWALDAAQHRLPSAVGMINGGHRA
jgi:hypothetical protein